MESYPERVPRTVVAYFEHFHEGAENLRNIDFDEEDFDVLGNCIQSTSCEKVWDAINRRSDKCSPEKFAEAIVKTNWLFRTMEDRCPTIAEIAGYRKLAKKAQELLNEVHEVFEQSTIERVSSPHKQNSESRSDCKFERN